MELILNLKYNKIAFCYIQSLNDTMRHYFAAFFIPDIFLVSHGAKCNGLQSMVRFRHVVSANEISRYIQHREPWGRGSFRLRCPSLDSVMAASTEVVKKPGLHPVYKHNKIKKNILQITK